MNFKKIWLCGYKYIDVYIKWGSKIDTEINIINLLFIFNQKHSL